MPNTYFYAGQEGAREFFIASHSEKTIMMHELRGDSSYRDIMDEIIEVPEGADTRGTEAIKRVSTAFLKPLFPHTRDAGDIKALEFERYCLRPAKKHALYNQKTIEPDGQAV